MPPSEEDGDPRQRDESGRVVETVTPDRVLDAVHEVIREQRQPFVTVADVADHLGVSGESARRKLTALADDGRVDRRKVGGRAVVWWPTPDADDELLSDAERAALEGHPEVARSMAALAENDPALLDELRGALGDDHADGESA